MSGICSTHRHHEPGCPRCEALAVLTLYRSMPLGELRLLRDALALDLGSPLATAAMHAFCTGRLQLIDDVLRERDSSHEPGCGVWLGQSCSCSPWKEP